MVLLKYAGVAQDRQSLTRSKLCNSTFLFDKTTNFSPKLEEFREIVHELAVEERRKVAVFSEYVSGGMSVVHCGGPGTAGPPALDGGEWSWQSSKWSQDENHVGCQGWRSISLGHLILPSTYSDEPRRQPNDSWYGLVREAEGTKSGLEKKLKK